MLPLLAPPIEVTYTVSLHELRMLALKPRVEGTRASSAEAARTGLVNMSNECRDGCLLGSNAHAVAF